MCNFKAKCHEQLLVMHLDGDLNNVDWSNLKTVCSNCGIYLKKTTMPWKASTIHPDF